MPKRPAVECGFLELLLSCPRCHEKVDAGAHLGAVNNVDENGNGVLKAKLKAKPVDHMCGQIRLTFAGEAGPVDNIVDVVLPMDEDGGAEDTAQPWIATGGD